METFLAALGVSGLIALAGIFVRLGVFVHAADIAFKHVEKVATNDLPHIYTELKALSLTTQSLRSLQEDTKRAVEDAARDQRILVAKALDSKSGGK